MTDAHTPNLTLEPFGNLEPNIIIDTGIQKIRITQYEARGIQAILSAYLDTGQLINQDQWNGLVTVEKDGQETIQGWYGSFDVAQYVANNQVENKRTKGARAYALIGQYGAYSQEEPVLSDEETETEEPEKEPEQDRTQTKMDRWFA